MKGKDWTVGLSSSKLSNKAPLHFALERHFNVSCFLKTKKDRVRVREEAGGTQEEAPSSLREQ